MLNTGILNADLDRKKPCPNLSKGIVQEYEPLKIETGQRHLMYKNILTSDNNIGWNLVRQEFYISYFNFKPNTPDLPKQLSQPESDPMWNLFPMLC